MRPSFELDSDILAAAKSQHGTERHTLADGPNALRAGDDRTSLVDEFFSAGDEGRYEGGPATLEPIDEIELDETPVAVVLRTPEMDARRARFARGVAAAIGCLTAVLAIGLVRSRLHAAPSEEPERAAAAVTVRQSAPAKPVKIDAPVFAKSVMPPAAPAPEPAATPAAPEAKREAAPEAKLETAPAEKVQVAAAPKLEAKAAAPAPTHVAASKPAVTAFVAPAPAKIEAPAAPTRALPSVGNFAARAGDAPKSASTPTASFAPVH